MRIAYLLAEDLSKHPGLKHKIDSQTERWSKAGHDVYKILHYSGGVIGPDGQMLAQRKKLATPPKGKKKIGLFVRLSKQYAFAAAAIEMIRPDITYSRYLFPAWGVWNISKHAGKVVFEINSDDVSEYAAKNRLTGIFNRLFRGLAFRMARGFVFVTRELACSSAFSKFAPARIVIANGIECDRFPFVLESGNVLPQLVFIGSPGQSWHGLDKLHALACMLTKCTIHVIGPSERECRHLWGELPANVVVHGYLGGADAARMVSKMDLGISTLALHRKNMKEACPLKVRQYLAQGLPVLAASEDTDISSDQDFYFQLPNCEGNVLDNRKTIEKFVWSVFGSAGLRREAREYAMTRMTVEKKERDRLCFFQSLLDRP